MKLNWNNNQHKLRVDSVLNIGTLKSRAYLSVEHQLNVLNAMLAPGSVDE